MKVDLVADVGNSRIKWAVSADPITRTASLPHADADAWHAQLAAWEISGPRSWAVAGVHPAQRDELVRWLRELGHEVCVIDQPKSLPLQVQLEHPERVGIDRLLDAVAANARRGEQPAIVIDAGSAVTVDLVDATGVFRGGTIFPGIRLMAKALNDYTALLPLVEITEPVPTIPATTTSDAMKAGIYHAVAGGILNIIRQYRNAWSHQARIYLTGGDAALLQAAMPRSCQLWPAMTLEGIRMAAEAQP